MNRVTRIFMRIKVISIKKELLFGMMLLLNILFIAVVIMKYIQMEIDRRGSN